MSYTINNINFSYNTEEGEVGHLFMSNNYAVIVIKTNIENNYNISFMKRINQEAWSTSLDDKLLTVSETSEIKDLTENQIVNYINQVANL